MYMNDAYMMFVRLTGGIPDVNSAACTVLATALEATSPLHPKIQRIRMATLMPEGRTIKVINAQDMENLSDEDFGVLRSVNTSTATGKVRYMVTGMQQDMVRWVNIPDIDYEIQILIERLPLDDIVGLGQEFTDVQSQHHFHFLKWMEHLAYNKQDAETYNRAKSADKKTEFEMYCELAKREKDRYKHKVRVVRYGGL